MGKGPPPEPIGPPSGEETKKALPHAGRLSEKPELPRKKLHKPELPSRHRKKSHPPLRESSAPPSAPSLILEEKKDNPSRRHSTNNPDNPELPSRDSKKPLPHNAGRLSEKPELPSRDRKKSHNRHHSSETPSPPS